MCAATVAISPFSVRLQITPAEAKRDGFCLLGAAEAVHESSVSSCSSSNSFAVLRASQQHPFLCAAAVTAAGAATV